MDLKTKPPSPLAVYVKEEHETPPECSNAEFNCVDSQPVVFKNEPVTKNAIQQQENLLKHQEYLLIIYQKDQSLKNQEHSLNHQPEINIPPNSTVSDEKFCEKNELTVKAHSRGKPFTCSTCQKCFVKRYQLRAHSLIHEATYFFCDVCHKEFTTTKSDFKSHMQQHYLPLYKGLYKCEHCSQCYSHKNILMSHYRVEHPPKRVISDEESCENSELTEQEALVVREQQHRPDNMGQFKCKHCPKHYAHEKSLTRHCRMEHPPQKRVFSDTEFCEKRKLTDLVASEKNESNKTESSIATVMSEEAIKKVVDNHKDNVLLEFEIPISDKGFVEKREENVTTPECSNAEFNCADSQPVEFKNEPETEHALQQQEHLLKHQEDLLIYQEDINHSPKSAVSDEEFCEKSELTMKAHSRGKPFTCPTCQKCFVKRSQLREHSLVHEATYFFCDVCHKEFTTTKSDFKSHMKQHYKPVDKGLFKCEHCSQCYSHKKYLTNHYRVEHPPKRVLSDEEFCENSQLTETEQVDLVVHEKIPDIIKGPFKCAHCPKDYTHKKSLMRHCRMEHPPQKRFFSDTEFCEKRKLTDLVASEKNESNKTESSIATVMSEEAIKKVVDNHKDNVLLEFEIPISGKGFVEKREENVTTPECSNAEFNCADSQPVEFKNEPETELALQQQEHLLKHQEDLLIYQEDQSFKHQEHSLNHQPEINHSPKSAVSDEEFCEKSELTMKAHSRGKPFTCPTCQKCFVNRSLLRAHSLVHEATYFCEVCHKEFTTTKSDFKSHMEQHYKPLYKGLFQCEHCSQCYSHKKIIMSHYRVEHPPKRVLSDEEFKVKSQEVDHVICKVCHKEFSSIHILGRHMRQHIKGHRGPFKCEKCTEQFHSRFVLLRHYEKQHPPKRIIADSFKKATKTRSRVKRFTCPTCQKCFVKRSQLREHSLIHKATYFFCEVCHKEFTTTKSDFKSHMQQHYKPVDKGLFKCEHCSQCYSHKKNLMNHYRVKHPPKRYISDEEFCENSELTEIEQVDLVVHEKIPDIIKGPFKCAHCPKDYTHKKSLNRHCRMEHPPQKRAFSDTEFCEKRKRTDLVASVKSEPNETDSSIATVMSEEAVKKTVDDQKDNILLESDIPISDEGICEKSELSKLTSSIKSEPSSSKSPYVNLENDKFNIEDYILPELDMPVSDNEFGGESELNQLVSTVKSEPSPETPYLNLDDDKFTVEEIEVKIEEANVDYQHFSLADEGFLPFQRNSKNKNKLDTKGLTTKN